MIRKAIAAVAVLIAATIVSLTPEQATTLAPTQPAVPVNITSTAVLTEDDPAWDCRLVTEHSNGVCGTDLPQGVNAADFPQCVDPALYERCVAAVRANITR